MRWAAASGALDETRLFIGMVCMRETFVAFDEFAALVNNVAAAISKNDVESYKKSREELVAHDGGGSPLPIGKCKLCLRESVDCRTYSRRGEYACNIPAGMEWL